MRVRTAKKKIYIYGRECTEIPKVNKKLSRRLLKPGEEITRDHY